MNFDHFAADHAFANDFGTGVGADETPQAAVQSQTQHYFSARRRGGLDHLYFARLDSLDANARACFNAADLREADGNMERIAPEPLPAAHGKYAGGGECQAGQNHGTED
jgi:hypothetical protein